MRRFCLLSATVAAIWVGMGSPAFAEISCPGPLPGGRPPALVPPEVKDVPMTAEMPPASIGDEAIKIVSRFEAGGGDPYTNVSSQERVSLGYLQWNWETRSLTRTLLANIPDSAIDLAVPAIKSDLQTLKKSGLSRSADETAAKAVIASWTTPMADDPLVRDLRKSIRKELAAWLGLEAVRAAQKTLVDRKVATAYAYVKAWRRDAGTRSVSPTADTRMTAYFFDMVVFNGGRSGLWVPHVRAFRAEHPDAKAVVTEIKNWLDRCVAARMPSNRYHKLYNAEDAAQSGGQWLDLVMKDPNAIDEDQLDMLVFGFLRAIRSYGDDAPRAFPGVYQADVMNRRGILAVGVGTTGGVPVKIF